METIVNKLIFFNEYFTFFVIFPTVLVLGLYLTIRLKGVQITQLGKSFTSLLGKSEGKGNISHYEAVSAVLAGNLGTGNISGIAVAVVTGGPGSLVWMWVMAFLGSVIQYASCTLGVRYRQQNEDGEYVGGPMYYLQNGLKSKTLGILFSLFSILAAFTVGNFVQINSVILPLQKFTDRTDLWSIVIALCVGVVILGGMQRFARVASSVVPIKALLYLGTALVILALNYDKVGSASLLMIKSAFSTHSLVGGVLGYSVVKAMTAGFARGIFATDAGTGIAPLIQSSAKTTHPIQDGIVALCAPFLVMIVCTVTGLVLIVTEAWQVVDLKSTNMCTYAFSKGLGSDIGGYIVILSLILFAFTTILSWGICLERSVEYLLGRRWVKIFKLLYICLIPVGAYAPVEIIWLIADIAIGFMMLTNLIGVAGLSTEVESLTSEYFGDTEEIATA